MDARTRILGWSQYNRFNDGLPQECHGTWDEFEATLREYAGICHLGPLPEGEDPKKIKHGLHCFSPALVEADKVSSRGSHRLMENVRQAGMVAFDFDRSDPSLYDWVRGWVRALGLEALMYTTFSSVSDCRRFRLVMLLDRDTHGNQEYKDIYSALERALRIMYEYEFGEGSSLKTADLADLLDARCWNGSWLFSFPAGQLDAPVVERMEGNPVDVTGYLGVFPPPVQKPREPVQLRPRRHSLLHVNIHQSTLVTQEILDEYRASDRHKGRFKALCRIAGRAKTSGFPMDEALLSQIASELDGLQGEGDRWSMYEYESRRVLGRVS